MCSVHLLLEDRGSDMWMGPHDMDSVIRGEELQAESVLEFCAFRVKK